MEAERSPACRATPSRSLPRAGDCLRREMHAIDRQRLFRRFEKLQRGMEQIDKAHARLLRRGFGGLRVGFKLRVVRLAIGTFGFFVSSCAMGLKSTMRGKDLPFGFVPRTSSRNRRAASCSRPACSRRTRCSRRRRTPHPASHAAGNPSSSICPLLRGYEFGRSPLVLMLRKRTFSSGRALCSTVSIQPSCCMRSGKPLPRMATTSPLLKAKGIGSL
jgi:hypothetical protein